MSCWSKCCKTSVQGKDEGEWIEPITPKNRRSKRHSAKIKDSGRDNDKGSGHGRLTVNRQIQSQGSVRWADLTKNKGGQNASELDLDNPTMDNEIIASVNRLSVISGLTMASTIPDDSVIRNLKLEEVDGQSRLRLSNASDLSDLSDGNNSEVDTPINKLSAGLLSRRTIAFKKDTSALKNRLTMGKHEMLGKLGMHERERSPSPSSSEGNPRRTMSSKSMPQNRTPMLAAKGISPRKRKTLFPGDVLNRGMKAGNELLEDAKSKGGLLRKDPRAVMPLTELFGFKRPDSSRSIASAGSGSVTSLPAITSIAVLSDGYFLTASCYDKVIKLYKQEQVVSDKDAGSKSKVAFVREFSGHPSAVTAIVVVDRKGRFLSAGLDKTVRLWDSRFNCDDDPVREETHQEPMTLLATFRGLDRWVHSISVLSEGSYVRPTDSIDADMVAAMAKKTVLEGQAAVQRAAVQREIIECSGSFITASKNCKDISIWAMSLTKKSADADPHTDVAKISLSNKLENNAVITAIEHSQKNILAGDVMGNVCLWQCRRSSFGTSLKWNKICEFTSFSRNTKLQTLEETKQNSIDFLCFLEAEREARCVPSKFAAGMASGKIRVWEIGKVSNGRPKKQSVASVKITSGSLSGIQQLPSIKDPNTGEQCLAFSASSADGHVISMALYPEDKELVMFHMYDHSPARNDDKERGISSIAFDDGILIAGDGDGSIHLLKPEWKSDKES